MMKIKINKKTKKNNLSQFELTCQTHNLIHMTEISSQKQVKTNYEAQSSINLILKDKIEKKSIKSKT